MPGMTRTGSRATNVAGWVILGVGSSLAGVVAQLIGLPAGWLVGPMLVALTVALVWEKHPTMPRWGRIASLAVVGGVLASAFRPSVLPLISHHWMGVALVVCGTLLLSLGAGLLLSVLVRLDREDGGPRSAAGRGLGDARHERPSGRRRPPRRPDAVHPRRRCRRLGHPGRPPRARAGNLAAASLGARPAGDPPKTADLLVQGLPE